MSRRCCCGDEHAGDGRWAIVDEIVAQFGETIVVATPAGSWNVPRSFIALHGLKGEDVGALADKYGWQRA